MNSRSKSQSFPLQTVWETFCSGGCGTHMGHLMVHQYQGSWRGPMGDLGSRGPLRSGPCLAHHPAASKISGVNEFLTVGILSRNSREGSVHTLEILGIMRRSRKNYQRTLFPLINGVPLKKYGLWVLWNSLYGLILWDSAWYEILKS